MKRACIYVIYDGQSVVNPYISNIIKELQRFAKDIFVVCNFEQIVSGEHYIKPYARDIYFRKNEGFDAGAYRDALIDYITWEVLENYDELIITNDTYFGPLYKFDNMFGVMETAECDYWGITRHPICDTNSYEEHIQSYFLCFKTTILHDSRFKEFWCKYLYAKDRDGVIAGFEVGINTYLRELGYKGISYMDINGVSFQNCNPYIAHAYELIKDGKIPVIKKTNFRGNNRWLVNSLKALDYIEMNCDFDVTVIRNYIDEYRKKGLLGTYYDFDNLRDFVNAHRRIYIYGSGVWGQITADYLDYKGLQYEGFVVTKSNNIDEREFRTVKINERDGVIIAQEYRDVCETIKNYVRDCVRDSQIFTPCYVEKI